MSDEDYALAVKLQKQFNDEVCTSPRKYGNVPVRRQPTTSLVDPDWEITDPNPDIHMLFGVFNVKFFWNTLGAVEVKWSPRMYMCAGICTYKGKAGCVVSLSLPLLKFRPRKDLVETLLHEMIHAYLFVTKNNQDRASHGPEFCKHMGRINKEAGTNITIYHSFHEEVNHYRTHVWRCNGSCRADPPYFGYVRRATNRAPGPNDFWFADHRRSCGGSFGKVGEPDGFVAKPRKKLKTEHTSSEKVAAVVNKTPPSNNNLKDIRNFFTSTPFNTPPSSCNVLATSVAGSSMSKVVPDNTKVSPSGKTTTSGLTSAVHGIESKTKQGDLLVKHGGVSNNIFGFGNPSGENDSKNRNFKIPVVPFAGKGYVLGSSVSKDKTKSRLLSEFSSNDLPVKKEPNSPPSTSSRAEETPVYFEDLTGFDDDFDSPSIESVRSSEDDESGVLCPVCNAVINQGISVNEHLDECNILEKVFNSSRHDILSDSDSDDDYPTPSITSPKKAANSPPVNCPNCNAVLTASTINQHLDDCLSFE